MEGKVFFVLVVTVGDTSLSREFFVNQQQSHEDLKKEKQITKKGRKKERKLKTIKAHFYELMGGGIRNPLHFS